MANEGTYTLIKAHRLVAKHFLANYTEELTVNHKNHDRWDNRADNLEMMTLHDNIIDGIRKRTEYFIPELNINTCHPQRVILNQGLKFSRYMFLKSLRDGAPYYDKLTFKTVENKNE